MNVATPPLSLDLYLYIAGERPKPQLNFYQGGLTPHHVTIGGPPSQQDSYPIVESKSTRLCGSLNQNERNMRYAKKQYNIKA